MTLSISDIKPGSRGRLKPMLIYLAASLFCVLFNAIYSRFSHGVSSASMTFMIAYPFAGGALIYLLLAATRTEPPGRLAGNLYNSGIATLTAGSALKGICDIAGTSSPYQAVYWILGAAMIISALAVYAGDMLYRRRRTGSLEHE